MTPWDNICYEKLKTDGNIRVLLKKYKLQIYLIDEFIVYKVGRKLYLLVYNYMRKIDHNWETIYVERTGPV